MHEAPVPMQAPSERTSLELFDSMGERDGPGSLPAAPTPEESLPSSGVLHFRATEVHRWHDGVDAPEWSVRYRPLLALAAGMSAQFSQLCIDGTAAVNVREVRVWVQAESVFAMDSHGDRRVRGSSAGEILLAMSCMTGQAGMCIGARDLARPPTPRHTLVQLRLRATDLSDLLGVRVLAR